jgi:hypothetical protein
MKILKVGDKQKAVCYKCKAVKNTTFYLRDVPFSDGSGIVKNILVGVCDFCDGVIITPHQSTPAIKKELDKCK